MGYRVGDYIRPTQEYASWHHEYIRDRHLPTSGVVAPLRFPPFARVTATNPYAVTIDRPLPNGRSWQWHRSNIEPIDPITLLASLKEETDE